MGRSWVKIDNSNDSKGYKALRRVLKPKTSDRASNSQEVKPDPIARFKKSRDASRALQKTKLAEGVKGINRYVEDVEGDWLENWSDEE